MLLLLAGSAAGSLLAAVAAAPGSRDASERRTKGAAREKGGYGEER